MRHTLLIVGLLLAAVLCASATAETRLENKTYGFAFTFEANCEISYEADGVGFVATHLPPASKKGDYGMLVYGSPAMTLNSLETEAAKLAPEQSYLLAADVTDDKRWVEIFTAVMDKRGATKAGEAKVKTMGGSKTVPYYTWEQSFGGRTHYALMYVVKHGPNFIYLQVESSKPLSDKQQLWMATKLELLQEPASKEANPS
jgi:hypothetical protein